MLHGDVGRQQLCVGDHLLKYLSSASGVESRKRESGLPVYFIGVHVTPYGSRAVGPVGVQVDDAHTPVPVAVVLQRLIRRMESHGARLAGLIQNERVRTRSKFWELYT